MKINRRMVLKGIAGTFIALPFLESVARAAPPSPKRFITVFTPNGLPRAQWSPSGDTNNFTLGPILQPLEAHRDYLNVIEGLDNKASQCRGHDTATVSLFTGASASSVDPPTSSGMSIDQAIANLISNGTKVSSLQLGAMTGRSTQRYMSHAGPSVPLPAENDPMRVYTRLFGGGAGAGGEAATAALKLLRDRRKAVMDGAMGDIASLKQRISSADKQRLDAHLEAIRAVEKAIDSEGAPISCVAPGAPSAIDPGNVANFPAIIDLHTKLLVLAMRCDITRVASLQWSESTGPIPFTWLGINTEAHELSHRANDPDYVKICTWYSTKFAELLKQLRDPTFVDGNGQNLLDNTAVLWINELSSFVHDNDDMPVVLAGKAGVGLKTNRYLTYGTGNGCPTTPNTVALNKLFVSLLNMYGSTQNSFGDSQYGTGPLPGLV